jgi:NCS1 family nucleobase:cation symporter-1
LQASEGLEDPNSGLVRITLSSVTGVVGSWAALALNIMDFTRFTHSQKDQMLGQLYALPAVTTLVAFLGIFVTSATVSIYGTPIWNPVISFSFFSYFRFI